MNDRSIEVFVVRDAGTEPGIDDQEIESLVRFALDSELLPGDWRVAIRFVGLEAICDLHSRFMNDPEPTDILTFPYDEPDRFGGDIAIAVPVAEVQARDAGTSLGYEVAFLILHGLLHLAGHDDSCASDRASMLNRQTRILEAWPGFRSSATRF